MASFAPSHVVYDASWIALTIMNRNTRIASYDQVSPIEWRSSVSNPPSLRFHPATREASAAWVASWGRRPLLPLFLLVGRPTLSGDGGPSRFLCDFPVSLPARLFDLDEPMGAPVQDFPPSSHGYVSWLAETTSAQAWNMHSHSCCFAPRRTSLAHGNLTCLTAGRILEIGSETRKSVPVRARGKDGKLSDVEAAGREGPVLPPFRPVGAALKERPVGADCSVSDETIHTL